jgi:hypothetical protein
MQFDASAIKRTSSSLRLQLSLPITIFYYYEVPPIPTSSYTGLGNVPALATHPVPTPIPPKNLQFEVNFTTPLQTQE